MNECLLGVLVCAIVIVSSSSAVSEEVSTPSRSDGRTLHVDFENYTDGVFAPLNAGVVTVGMQEIIREPLREGRATVLRDFAFDGKRCLAVRSTTGKKRIRIAVQKRFDVPDSRGDSVIELVFRPVRRKAVDLQGWGVWDGRSRSGRIGLRLIANGTAQAGVYSIDIFEGDSSKPSRKGRWEEIRRRGVLTGLKQNEWTRFILHRRREPGEVVLWAGPAGEEKRVGVFTDLQPAGAFYQAKMGSDGRKSAGAGMWDSIRVGRPLAAGAEVCPAEPRIRDVGATVPAPPTPIEVGRAKQLFIDDWVVEETSNLRRTLHPVKKHPHNPLLVADKPWEGTMVLLYGAVHRDEATEKFHMWYLAWNSYNAKKENRPNEKSFICYATSDDGFTWEKPELGIYEYRGSKKNNIVIGYGMSNTTVFHDPRDPDASRRFKGVIRHNGTRAYFSPDGVRWKDAGVILQQCYDSTSVHWDPIREKWIASVKIIAGGKRTRGYAESDDLLHWSDTYLMATVDGRDSPRDQVYAMTIFYYETIYLGLWRMYHVGTSHKVDIQLAISHNARHWERPLRKPFIPTSAAEGSWDYGNNAPSTDDPIRMGDELWFYYSGRSIDHAGRPAMPGTGSIGLGTLRLDGFVSLDAGEKGGTVLTRPLTLGRGKLFVNADADGGEITAEIVDAAGKPIAPFAVTNCQPVTDDSVRQRMTWQGARALPKGTVRLRFRLKSAKLYAFWVE